MIEEIDVLIKTGSSFSPRCPSVLEGVEKTVNDIKTKENLSSQSQETVLGIKTVVSFLLTQYWKDGVGDCEAVRNCRCVSLLAVPEMCKELRKDE